MRLSPNLLQREGFFKGSLDRIMLSPAAPFKLLLRGETRLPRRTDVACVRRNRVDAGQTLE
jgi:hypothetical protein